MGLSPLPFRPPRRPLHRRLLFLSLTLAAVFLLRFQRTDPAEQEHRLALLRMRQLEDAEAADKLNRLDTIHLPNAAPENHPDTTHPDSDDDDDDDDEHHPQIITGPPLSAGWARTPSNLSALAHPSPSPPAPALALNGRTLHRLPHLRGTSCYTQSDPTGAPGPTFCAPSLLIAGPPRTATTAMFYKLSLHSSALAPAPAPSCPAGPLPAHLASWLLSPALAPVPAHRRRATLLAACHPLSTHPAALAELLRLSPELRVVAMVRNFADWAYSDFAASCRPGWDPTCASADPDPDWRQRRNPDDFHAVVTQRHPAFCQLQLPLALFRPWLERLLAVLGPERVVVVRQEDLALEPRRTLETVAQFAGLDDVGFSEEAATLVTNAQGTESAFAWIEEEAGPETVEAVLNSGSEMRDDTRRILDDNWRGECEWLRDHLGVSYPKVC